MFRYFQNGNSIDTCHHTNSHLNNYRQKKLNERKKEKNGKIEYITRDYIAITS